MASTTILNLLLLSVMVA